MKNALYTIKFLFVTFCWTLLLCCSFAFALRVFWDFNVFNYKSWEIIAKWWQRGGNINSWQDFMFFLILLMFIPLLILGIRRGMKINFLQLAVKPIMYFMNRGLDEEPQNITIKNIDVSVQKTSKEEFVKNIVEERMKKMEENTPQEQQAKTYDKIRKQLAEKEKDLE